MLALAKHKQMRPQRQLARQIEAALRRRFERRGKISLRSTLLRPAAAAAPAGFQDLLAAAPRACRGRSCAGSRAARPRRRAPPPAPRGRARRSAAPPWGCCRSRSVPPGGAGTTAAAAQTTAGSQPAAATRTSAGRAVSASCSRCASAATVGASNRVRIGSSTSRLRADAADQPRRQQRVAAEREEVVVDADALRGRAPRRTASKDLFLRRARRAHHRRRRCRAPAAPGGRACRSASAAGGRAPRRPPAPCSRAGVPARCARSWA